MFSFSLSLRLCLLVGLSSSLLHTIQARSHDFQAGHHRRSNKDVFPQTDNFTNAESDILEKRGGDKRFSWYQTGQGACGGFNGPDDFIVALNTPQWDGGNHCYEMISISYQGKTAQAQIVDRCVECPPGALDFSHGLFAYFAGSPEQVGIIYGDWTFGAGEPSPSPEPSTTRQHTPDPTPDPTPESTPEPSPSPEPTTSTHSTHHSTSVTPTSTPEPTSSTVSPTPSQSAAPEVPQLFQLANTALIQLGGVVVAGLSVQSSN
ncbi:hypothetical protein VKT23_005545 [Stygiomarasmius scandens]|uniref:Uncharacterized protein n=1 Tax=Marasmiellus scandens TaxID=2682957 RepID=A0ABR1JNF0_9AGAR